MDPLTMALIAGGGAALGALPDLIPSKYEREQKKELKDLQRRQELGLLGLTEAERARLEGQLEGRSRQGQAYAQAETARLSAPTAQPQQALLQSQLAAEAAQRQEAEIAQQLLGMDIAKQQAEEQQIRDLEAAQAEYKRRRAEAAVAPFQAGAEAAVGSIATEKLLSSTTTTSSYATAAIRTNSPASTAILYANSTTTNEPRRCTVPSYVRRKIRWEFNK